MADVIIQRGNQQVVVTTSGARGPAGAQGAKGLDASEQVQRKDFSAALGNMPADLTNFSLPFVYDPNKVYATINGLLLEPSDFYAPGGNLFTLTDPVAATDSVTVFGFLPGNSSGEYLTVKMFGAKGDGVTDDAPAFNRAFTYLKAQNGGRLIIPRGVYVVKSPLIWSSLSPLTLSGMGGGSSTPFSYEGMTVIRYEGPKGTNCFLAETPSATNGFECRGITIDNILFFRPVEEQKADPRGAGIAVKGCTKALVENCSIWGFADGFNADDNPSNAGSTSIRSGQIVLRQLWVNKAARRRVSISGSAEIALYSCMLQADAIAGYSADLYCGPGSNGGRTDAIKAWGCTFIGGTEVVADMPDYNVQLDRALWCSFYGCAFERARLCGLQVSNAVGSDAYIYSMGEGDWLPHHIYGCEFNAMAGMGIDVFGARFTARDNSIHQLQGATFPSIRVRNGSGTQIPPGSVTISGGKIGYEGPCGIDIDNISKAMVDGNIYFIDKVKTRNQASKDNPSITGKPNVKLGQYTSYCSVLLPGGTGYEAPPQDLGTFNTLWDAGLGLQYNKGLSTQQAYVTGTLDNTDPNGTALIAHNFPLFVRYHLESTAYVQPDGPDQAWVPIDINFIDNSAFRVTGRLPTHKGKKVKIVYTFKQNGVL